MCCIGEGPDSSTVELADLSFLEQYFFEGKHLVYKLCTIPLVSVRKGRDWN